MTHFVDETTKASMPGQIQISKSKFLDYHGISGARRLKYRLLFALPQSLVLKLFGSNPIVNDFVYKTEHFKYGCLNPTMVVNKDKGLIATFTNLTSYGDSITPVIKISQEPLELIHNVNIQNGQTLPTVALYYRDEEEEEATAWADFDPKIANCFTNDISVCKGLLDRIPENGWQCLAKGLSQIEDVEMPGLYYVTLDKKLVQNAY